MTGAITCAIICDQTLFRHERSEMEDGQWCLPFCEIMRSPNFECKNSIQAPGREGTRRLTDFKGLTTRCWLKQNWSQTRRFVAYTNKLQRPGVSQTSALGGTSCSRRLYPAHDLLMCLLVLHGSVRIIGSRYHFVFPWRLLWTTSHHSTRPAWTSCNDDPTPGDDRSCTSTSYLAGGHV